MPHPKRRSPRLKAYDYASEGAYFVTVCSADRACIFGQILWDAMQPSATAQIVETCWREIPVHYPGASTDAFVVMPNHVHGILWLERAGHAPPLHRVVSSFKAAASRQAGRPLWQRSFHDRIVRDEAELIAVRQYVLENPLRGRWIARTLSRAARRGGTCPARARPAPPRPGGRRSRGRPTRRTAPRAPGCRSRRPSGR